MGEVLQEDWRELQGSQRGSGTMGDSGLESACFGSMGDSSRQLSVKFGEIREGFRQSSCIFGILERRTHNIRKVDAVGNRRWFDGWGRRRFRTGIGGKWI